MSSSRSRPPASRRSTGKPSRAPDASASAAALRLSELEDVFAALAHEQRRHILLTLHFRGGSMSAGAIAERFRCSWPTTTRHLSVVVSAGLVSVHKEGRKRIYTLNRERLLSVAGDWLDWFRT